VNALGHLYKSFPDLLALILSVIYLIKGAVFRARTATVASDSSSLSICSIGELLDMYHTHQATKPHDKVYALLGMCSDDLSKIGISPNYKMSWEELLQRLCKVMLCEQVLVEAWPSRQLVVIRGKGCILGTVVSEMDNITLHDTQTVDVIFFNNSDKDKRKIDRRWITPWTIQASAKAVRCGDLVFLLDGCTKLAIIRPCKGHFAVIMIAAVPPGVVKCGSGARRWPRFLDSALETTSYHNFVLAWDWDYAWSKPLGCEVEARKQEALVCGHEKSEYLITRKKDHADSVIEMWNVLLILLDTELFHLKPRYEYEFLFSRSNVNEKEESRKDGIKRAILVDAVERISDINHEFDKKADEDKSRILKELGKLTRCITDYASDTAVALFVSMMTLFYQGISTGEKAKAEEEAIGFLLQCFKGSDRFMTNILSRGASRSIHEYRIITFVLDRIEDVTEAVLEAAASNVSCGYGIMKLLLDRADGLPITEAVLKAAAFNQWSGLEIMKLLFDRRVNDIFITEAVIVAAASSEDDKLGVLKFLLDSRDDFRITERAILQMLNRAKWDPKECLQLLLDHKCDIPITEAMLEAAAGGRYGAVDTMDCLLDRKSGDISITEGIVKAARQNRPFGPDIISLILDRRGEGIITNAAVEAMTLKPIEHDLMEVLSEHGLAPAKVGGKLGGSITEDVDFSDVDSSDVE
jgi:hypothetical protein